MSAAAAAAGHRVMGQIAEDAAFLWLWRDAAVRVRPMCG